MFLNPFHNTIGSGRVYLYDHFGSLVQQSPQQVIPCGCGVGFVILDHLSIVVLVLTMVMNANYSVICQAAFSL